jgi:hypothetical protein
MRLEKKLRKNKFRKIFSKFSLQTLSASRKKSERWYEKPAKVKMIYEKKQNKTIDQFFGF